ncbi:helix-hairpin-helix domain-containing protein, partial [Sulfurovum sp.]|uniref:helix-hairpin-helix domain-containing protein n=1 Tax=Sulfurovum sp. TaxID=1969726 RepID=UPI002867E1DC
AKVAQNIVAYRNENGDFQTKTQLLKVKGLGKKAYEQAVGFIRIKNSQNIFDNSGIHPESYNVAKKLINLDLEKLDISEYASSLQVGEETLKDIIKELQKPGFDPREDLPAIPFKEGVTDIKMLKEGGFISGVVRNITDFGAFVDIGLKNDGLIHISKMGASRVKHPLEILSLNQYLPRIEVLNIEYEKSRVELGLTNF